MDVKIITTRCLFYVLVSSAKLGKGINMDSYFSFPIVATLMVMIFVPILVFLIKKDYENEMWEDLYFFCCHVTYADFDSEFFRSLVKGFLKKYKKPFNHISSALISNFKALQEGLKDVEKNESLMAAIVDDVYTKVECHLDKTASSQSVKDYLRYYHGQFLVHANFN